MGMRRVGTVCLDDVQNLRYAPEGKEDRNLSPDQLAEDIKQLLANNPGKYGVVVFPISDYDRFFQEKR